MFRCLQNDPQGFHFFIQADQEIKKALAKKDISEAIFSIKLLVWYIGALSKEIEDSEYHSLCYEVFDTTKMNWSQYDKILADMEDPDTDFGYADGHLYFNKVDITYEGHEMINLYIKDNWYGLGRLYGHTLRDAASRE